MNEIVDWFSSLSDMNQGIVLGALAILAVGFLTSFVFWGADFSGFGEFVKEVLGSVTGS